MNMFTIRLGWSDVMTNDDEIYKWRPGCFQEELDVERKRSQFKESYPV
jgi:hypothetical protein